MNFRKVLPLLLCSAAFSCFAADAAPDGEPPAEEEKETKVKKLDGTSILGIVEITDDYTIRVKSDSGIQNIPLALLGQKDFEKYGFKKDRSQDGRFWSERKNAVESTEDKPDKENNPDDPDADKEEPKPKKESAPKSNSALEINLAQIAPFQPLIAAYEQALGSKKKGSANKTGDATDKAKTPDTSSDENFKPLFSKPGISNAGQPFGGFGDTFIQPATTVGTTVISTVGGGAVPGIPALPSAPSSD